MTRNLLPIARGPPHYGISPGRSLQPLDAMNEKVLVTGATGKVGREVVRLLLDAGVEVKAGTRRPERATELFHEQVEVVELDYEHTVTFDGAVQWADRVFLVPPAFDPRADDLLVPFLDWAVQSGSRHLVLVSAMGIESRDDLSLRRVELRIERTGVAHTLLRPNVYMQNFSTGFIARRIRDDERFALAAGDSHVSFVDTRDVAAVAAAALTSDAHMGAAYTLTGPEALGHDAVARIIAGVAGHDVVYRPIDEDAMHRRLHDAGWDHPNAEAFLGLLRAIRNGVRARVTDDVARVLGRPPTDFHTFAEQHVESW